MLVSFFSFFFFFNDTPTTEIYTLSLHDALPIFEVPVSSIARQYIDDVNLRHGERYRHLRSPAIESLDDRSRSEEHTSELQSHSDLVCRLLLEKKKKKFTQ